MPQRMNYLTGQMEERPLPKTHLCPTKGRPTQKSISKTFGFQMPLSYVQLVEWIYDSAQGDPEACTELFAECFGVGVEDGVSGYESTPPELRTVSWPGVDGVHLGFLVHAPEVKQDDYPIAEFCPMDSDGVSLIGQGIVSGLVALGRQWSGKPERIELPAWQAAVAELDKRKPKKAETNSETNHWVVVPPQWRFQPSADGVGVLAPEELFGPQELVAVPADCDDFQAYVKPANAAIRKGYWAAALYYLREGYWHNWPAHPQPIAERLCTVYERLNRPGYASVVAGHMQKWSKKT